MTTPLFQSWRDRAKCHTTPLDRGADPFYPEGHINARAYDDAKRICAGCPVRKACLTDALDHRDIQGFRAGFTPEDLRKRLAAASASTPAQAARVETFTVQGASSSTKVGTRNRARVAELALTGMVAAKIAAETGLSLVTVSHHLKWLRDRSVIPIDAGTAPHPEPRCGTYPGYTKHTRDKTPKCRPCLDAHKERDKKYRAARKARREAAS